MQEAKYCSACGKGFYKRPKDTATQWESRLYCSVSCRNKSSIPVPLHLRFWKYVEKALPGECWRWVGVTDEHGYGKLTMPYGQSPIKAHRLSWEMHFGPIPEGAGILHTCDNPNCTNPEHLVPGDQKENMQQASARKRLNPRSQDNLCPGAKGFHGAGPISKREAIHGTRN